MLDDVLSSLKERERQILSLRFGLDHEGPYTLDQIGSRFGLTRERVRQIMNAALKKVRKHPHISMIQDFLS
jgi:RNA polymerase primary sigma factor